MTKKMTFKKAQRILNNQIFDWYCDMSKKIDALERQNDEALKAHATRGLLISILTQRIEQLEKKVEQLEFSWIGHVEPKKPKRGKRTIVNPKRKNT